MMKIQINTDHSIEGSEALEQSVEADVRSALERYEDRLTRVEVYLSDTDGEKKDGGHDKQCLLEARPAGMQPVVVTGSADSVEQACHDATHKMLSLLESTFGRIDGRDEHATIRQNEPS